MSDYNPVTQSGSYFPTGGIQQDEQGRPFQMLSNGQRSYLPPQALGDYSQPAPYKAGLLGGGSVWNARTGQYDKKSNALEKFTLAGALAPFAAAALPAFGAGGSSTAAASAGAGGAQAAPGTVGAALSMSGPSFASQALHYGLQPAIGAVGGYFANRAANNAAKQAANTASASAKYAADLEAKAADAALAWLKEQNAQREAQLAPYRALGAGSVAQLQHAPFNMNPGTVGAAMGGR